MSLTVQVPARHSEEITALEHLATSGAGSVRRFALRELIYEALTHRNREAAQAMLGLLSSAGFESNHRLVARVEEVLA